VVVGDGGREVVVTLELAVMGKVQARNGQDSPHDVVAMETQLYNRAAVELPDELLPVRLHVSICPP
jgi:hypothetical protein